MTRHAHTARTALAVIPIDTRSLVLGLCALLAVLLVALLVVRLRRLRRLRRVKPEIRTRYPVVLAHGLFGFDSVRFFKWRHEYFRGVPRRLRDLGAEVHVPRVAPASGIAVRGAQLAERIRALPARRVNIVAHSMGGLDARYAIAKLGLADRVASLTTIGCPHRGSPLVDVTAGVTERFGLAMIAKVLGVGLEAFGDMTTEKMATFNREIRDTGGVAYGCVIAAVKNGARMNPLLVAPHLYLKNACGDNDGLVPATSQSWGDVLGSIDADHWAQIGWWLGFDAPDFYIGLVRELRARGF